MVCEIAAVGAYLYNNTNNAFLLLLLQDLAPLMGGVQETLKYKQVPVYRWAKLHLSSRSNSADQQIQQTFQADQADQIQQIKFK